MLAQSIQYQEERGDAGGGMQQPRKSQKERNSLMNIEDNNSTLFVMNERQKAVMHGINPMLMESLDESSDQVFRFSKAYQKLRKSQNNNERNHVSMNKITEPAAPV